jgi:hypothetical protein
MFDNQTIGENITVELKMNATKEPLVEDNVTNALIIFCYSVIIVVSLCGNVLVCKVAFGSKDMRSTTNMLIASLACSDIVMTAFNVPFNVARILLLDWPFGKFLCFFVPFIQTACVYVSTFTMTVIALHRLWTVTQRRTTHTFSAKKLWFTVLTIWLLAASLSLPHSVFNRVKEVVISDQTLVRCRVDFPKLNFDFNFPLFLSLEVFITQYLLPLSVTLVVYIKIGSIISKQGKLIGKLSDEKKRKQSEAKRRRIFMLALAVATFATCWFPINFYHLLVDFKVMKHRKPLFLIVSLFIYIT